MKGGSWKSALVTAGALTLLFVVMAGLPPMFGTPKVAYSDFRRALAEGRVVEVRVSRSEIRGFWREAGRSEPVRFEAVRVDDPRLIEELQARSVKTVGVDDGGFWSSLLLFSPLVLLLVLVWLGMGSRSGAPNSFLAIGKSKARVYLEKQVQVRFTDVAGVDEAKVELQEVIEFLRSPDKFLRIGGKLPKGVLLVGPPGTGKTLLARAVAGEASVPFLTISGSEFVELFVGVGAARVRDLFTQAKGLAPCIIFIDELDALGKARGLGPLSHDEREQTLNQLLVELDGFDPRSGVVLMAATNRPEILDAALLRAGRFDRQILVDRPDRGGRLAILKVHSRNVRLEAAVDLDHIAAMTPGMTGAELANLINEGALLAVRRGKDAVGEPELVEALERAVTGLEKRGRVLNRAERERVAHHEIGHALVALALPGSGQVQKISLIPRGISALGYTLQLPTEDRFLLTRAELFDRIAVLLGGRAAEELVLGDVSTGAHDDLARATDLARSMVKVYGMSDKLGELALERQPRSPQDFALGEQAQYGDEVAREIDSEVRRILAEQHVRAAALLRQVEPALRLAAQQLLTREVLSGDELRALAAQASALKPAA